MVHKQKPQQEAYYVVQGDDLHTSDLGKVAINVQRCETSFCVF